MKLFDYFYQYDYGDENHLIVFSFSRFNLIEVYLGWDEISSGDFPHIGLQIGGKSLAYFTFRAYKLNFTLVLASLLPKNLDHYRGNYDV